MMTSAGSVTCLPSALDNFVTRVECLTCCQPFNYKFCDLVNHLHCPHCGARYLPLCFDPQSARDDPYEAQRDAGLALTTG